LFFSRLVKRYGAGCKPAPAESFFLGLLNVTEQVANLLRQKRLVKRYGAGCKPAPAEKSIQLGCVVGFILYYKLSL
jgi:predicted RNase H-like nuclease